MSNKQNLRNTYIMSNAVFAEEAFSGGGISHDHSHLSSNITSRTTTTEEKEENHQHNVVLDNSISASFSIQSRTSTIINLRPETMSHETAHRILEGVMNADGNITSSFVSGMGGDDGNTLPIPLPLPTPLSSSSSSTSPGLPLPTPLPPVLPFPIPSQAMPTPTPLPSSFVSDEELTLSSPQHLSPTQPPSPPTSLPVPVPPNKRRNGYNRNKSLDSVLSGAETSITDMEFAFPTVQEMSSTTSRDIIALFDEPFYGLEAENDKLQPLPYVAEKQKVNVSVDDLSDVLRDTYLNETEEVLDFQQNVLEAEINNLSFTEKHRIMFDVHGMPQMNDNDDDEDSESNKIDEYLRKLDEELIKKISTDGSMSTSTSSNTSSNTNASTEAFVEAQFLNPSYVNSKAFRMMFVRRFLHVDNQFDVEQAAEKVIFHFNVKKMIFGNGDILGRDVKLSDLSEDDIDAMHSGAYQIMPIRDISGRCVVMYAANQRAFKTIENWMRASWYMFSATTRDVENQKTGLVTVAHFNPTNHGTDSFENIKKAMLVRDAFPLKTKALHYCYNDEAMKPLVTAQRVHFLNKNHRCHFREHLSRDHDEICFRLETFGITIDKEIFLPNGKLGLNWYNEWFRIRTALEQQEERQRSHHEQQQQQHQNQQCEEFVGADMIFPRQNDVLFGRAKKNREHTGNLRCAHLVEIHQKEYEEASKLGKTTIADKIVTMILDSNGRFLKLDKEVGWLEVGKKDAREKVSHFFRHLRSLSVPKTTPTTKDSVANKTKEKRPLPDAMTS